MLIKSIVNDLCRPLCTDIFGAVASWTTPTDIPAEEAAALKVFYDATGGTGWTNNTNWGTSATADDWQGVTVTAGHVTAISLPANNLIGAAGTTLDPLSATLVTLDLGGNTMTNIDITALTKLTNCDVSNCSLSIAEVDAVLAMLDGAGLLTGTLAISGNNAAPSTTGYGDVISLLSKAWTVTYSAPAPALTQAVTSGTLHIATNAGAAMFFHDSVDFSAYAGNDAGVTGGIAEFIDSAGKIAYAHIGAVGGGENLGDELISTWANHVSYPYETLTTTASTINSAINTTGLGYARFGIFLLDAGRILKAVLSVTLNSGNLPLLSYAMSNGTALTAITNNVPTYHTKVTESYCLQYSNASATAFSATNSLKYVTDVPATGLHLMSAQGGTVRNMAYTQTGFNPNTVTSVKIYEE